MKILTAKSWFDGRRYHRNEPVTLVIEGERIKEIITGGHPFSGSVEACEFIMPGMVEAHCHLFLDGGELDYRKRSNYFKVPFEQMLQVAEANISRSLASGITLIRDAGDRYGVNHHVRDGTCELDVRSSGIALRRPKRYGAFMAREVSTREEIRATVIELAKSVNDLKIIETGIIDFESGTVKGEPQFDLDDLSYVVDCAHEVGLKTFAHCSGAQGIDVAVSAGVDSIEHGFFMTRELLRKMASQGTAWVPTFSPVQFQWEQPESAGWNTDTVSKLRSILDSHREHVALAAQMGVNLVAGSDAGSLGVIHGKGLIDEIFHFLECGVPMERALSAATSIPRALWSTASSDVAKGSRADMVILGGDPFVDRTHLYDVRGVVRQG